MNGNFKPLIDVNDIKNMSKEELMNVTNHQDMFSLRNGELTKKGTPLEESREVSVKPFKKLWLEVSDKIKWVSKPKKSHIYFDYIYHELLEIYGEDMGEYIMRVHLDIIEVEFHKINGSRIDFHEILYGGCSLNQWKKLMKVIDGLFSGVYELKIQKLKS